jgi:hypothetical protein
VEGEEGKKRGKGEPMIGQGTATTSPKGAMAGRR